MGDEYKDSTKMLSEQDSFFIHAQEKEDKSKIDWFYIEVYQGRQETETLQRQLADKQYDPAEILHVLFDYTFFDRVIAGEYDWRVGDDKVLKDKCKGYISKAESVKKEIRDFAGPDGIARKVSYKQTPDEVNIYRQLLADALDKDRAKELLASMMKTDTKRCFEATEATSELYSALAKIRHSIETELLARLIDPKVKSRTAPLRGEDFEPPKLVEQKPSQQLEPSAAPEPDKEITRTDLKKLSDLEGVELEDVTSDEETRTDLKKLSDSGESKLEDVSN